MVYDVYANYIEDLETDYLGILNYRGKDFVEVKNQKPLAFTITFKVKVLVKARGFGAVTSLHYRIINGGEVGIRTLGTFPYT